MTITTNKLVLITCWKQKCSHSERHPKIAKEKNMAWVLVLLPSPPHLSLLIDKLHTRSESQAGIPVGGQKNFPSNRLCHPAVQLKLITTASGDETVGIRQSSCWLIADEHCPNVLLNVIKMLPEIFSLCYPASLQGSSADDRYNFFRHNSEMEQISW